jgi:hypothetical protein
MLEALNTLDSSRFGLLRGRLWMAELGLPVQLGLI